jgi:hypothetical protein
MPFNEKGEFIRTGPVRPSPDRPVARPRRQGTRSGGGKSDAIWWWIGGIAVLAALVGIVWAMWIFREWVMLAFGVWVAAHVRQMFR